MGRKCAVPHCYTGYRKCKEKASLYRVPDDEFFLSKWQEAIARDDRPITPKDYICEKHFKDDDILRRRIIKDVIEEYQRPRLKPDAIPSIFPDLPEFILKMVKKRRKMPVEDSNPTATNGSENTQLKDEHDVVEKKIKIEPLENSESENCLSTICETILINEEIDIKSEPEEQADQSTENEEDNEISDFGPKMHKCDECEYETKYPHNLRTHKTKHLTGDNAYIHCEHCPNFKTKWELTYRNHLKIKHGMGKQEIFKCNICPFETKVKLCLKRHYERHQRDTLEKIIYCNLPGCNYRSESEAVLIAHKLSHNFEINVKTIGKSKDFKCTECLFQTNSKTHITKHIKTAHNSGDNTIGLFVPKSRASVTNKLFYKCFKCSYKSKSQSNLMKHALKHKNYPELSLKQAKSKVWKCSKCLFATFFPQALKRHRETDCRDIFICEYCNYRCSNKCDFIKHSLTHRNISVEYVHRGVNIQSGVSERKGFRWFQELNRRNGDSEMNPVKAPELVMVKNEIISNVE